MEQKKKIIVQWQHVVKIGIDVILVEVDITRDEKY